jgi:hypothetical protein
MVTRQQLYRCARAPLQLAHSSYIKKNLVPVYHLNVALERVFLIICSKTMGGREGVLIFIIVFCGLKLHMPAFNEIVGRHLHESATQDNELIHFPKTPLLNTNI